MASIAYDSEEQWHSIRKANIGSSEVSALFGMHPFGLTKWKLYHIKRGTLPHNVDNKSTQQGKHFEPAIASYAQEKWGIHLRKVRRYITCDDCDGLGASIDYEEFGSGAFIPTELKFSLWGDGWEWEGEELIQAPDAYLIQVQHQLAATGAEYGQLVAFCGSDLRRMRIPRNESLIGSIKTGVKDFWNDVRTEKEPAVDFLADADALDIMANTRMLRSITLPPEFEPYCASYLESKKVAKTAEDCEDEAKARLVKAILDAGIGNDNKATAVCGPYTVKLTQVAENPGKEVTPAMVGTRVGGRKSYLLTRVTEAK